ncbi:MAG TPA: hypothetical protein VF974_02190 [Patescibacteria group bacterium]
MFFYPNWNILYLLGGSMTQDTWLALERNREKHRDQLPPRVTSDGDELGSRPTIPAPNLNELSGDERVRELARLHDVAQSQ